MDGAKETLAAADVAIIPDESTPIESEDSNLDKLEETILAASVESEVVRDKPEDADN